MQCEQKQQEQMHPQSLPKPKTPLQTQQCREYSTEDVQTLLGYHTWQNLGSNDTSQANPRTILCIFRRYCWAPGSLPLPGWKQTRKRAHCSKLPSCCGYLSPWRGGSHLASFQELRRFLILKSQDHTPCKVQAGWHNFPLANVTCQVNFFPQPAFLYS